MRNTDSSGKTVDDLVELWALSRSWPNGFSMTTRRHRSGSGWASPDLVSCSHTVGKRRAESTR